MNTIEFALREGDEYIPLIQLLKAASLVENGAEAQAAVEQGLVKHNGATELRKRAKCRQGDTIDFNDTQVRVN